MADAASDVDGARPEALIRLPVCPTCGTVGVYDHAPMVCFATLHRRHDGLIKALARTLGVPDERNGGVLRVRVAGLAGDLEAANLRVTLAAHENHALTVGLEHASDEIDVLKGLLADAARERDEQKVEAARAERAVADRTAEVAALLKDRDDARSALARAEARAEEAEADLDKLRADVETHLPAYVLDDGTGDEANARERVEYAGDELRRLRSAATKGQP